MKKIAIFILPVAYLLLVTSCRKDNFSTYSLPVGTISASVDNIPVKFTISAMADTVYSTGNYHVLVIQGWDGDAGNSNFISFSITHPGTGPLTAGSYTPFSFYYWDQSDSSAYIYSNVNPPQVNITAVTDSTIDGTFNSSVFNNFGVDYTSSHAITNGKFNVKFQSVPL